MNKLGSSITFSMNTLLDYQAGVGAFTSLGSRGILDQVLRQE